jgi:predicted neuraminidase
MFSKTPNLLILGVATVVPLVAQAPAPNYTRELGSATDGRFRPSALPGVEEAYLPPMFASSHAANLLLLRNGDLLCVWFSGSWEGNSDVAIMLARLRRGSNQWTSPQLVDHHAGESYQNPVLFEAPDGTLWLIHTTQAAGEGQANAKVLVTKSTDGGKTWPPPAVLFDTPGAFVRQSLLVMPNGDWMLPMYFTPSRGITRGAETNYSAVKISGDKGAHWKECTVPDSNGYVQPDVIQLNGHYLAFFRSRYADYIYRSASDDGCTWTAPRKTQLPNNNSSIQVTKLANGHLVLAFNNVSSVVVKGKPQAGPRKPLSVALSEDGGETWRWVRDLETGLPAARQLPADPIGKDQPGREEYSYPSIVQTPDGKINVAYTYRRFTIKTVRFDEGWIRVSVRTSPAQL